jgi:hypothetical protein
MKRINTLLAALFALSAATASHAGDALKIALTVKQNDQQIGAQTMLVEFGRVSSLRLDNGQVLEFTVGDRGGQADIAMKVFVNEGSSKKLISSPRIVAQLDSPASISLEQTSGETLSVSFLASKVAAVAPRSVTPDGQ